MTTAHRHRRQRSNRRRRVAGLFRPRPRPEPPREAVPVTSTIDRWEHRVLPSVYARAMESGSGACIALCRARVVMAAFASPPGPECPECGAIVNGDIPPRAGAR